MKWQEGPFTTHTGMGQKAHRIDANSSSKIRVFEIMSKLILVQNNNFSKVYTIYFEKK